VRMTRADRLPPDLLSCLTGEAGGSQPQGGMTDAQMLRAVLRNLNWLFNSPQLPQEWTQARPGLAGSVLNYGLPPFIGQPMGPFDIRRMESALRQAIVRFEPRIDPDTVEVHALESAEAGSDGLADSWRSRDVQDPQFIEFEIHGRLVAAPGPAAPLLRTRVDLGRRCVDVTGT